MRFTVRDREAKAFFMKAYSGATFYVGETYHTESYTLIESMPLVVPQSVIEGGWRHFNSDFMPGRVTPSVSRVQRRLAGIGFTPHKADITPARLPEDIKMEEMYAA